MGQRLGKRRVKGDAAPTIRRTVKLKLTGAQERERERWLWHLTGVYNWALRKIELDAKDRIYWNKVAFLNLLAGTAPKIDIPSQVIQGTLDTAYDAWEKCFKKKGGRPRMKGQRNTLNSIPFPDRTQIPEAGVLVLHGSTDTARESPWARILYKQQHAQAKHDPERRCMIDALPKEALRGCRIMKRASGWFASLVVEMPAAVIPIEGNAEVGIDLGYHTLATLSTGEKVPHPRELQATARRLGQAQRGGDQRLAARLQERAANQRRNRNHKLSRDLLKRFALICRSKDRLHGLARSGFGKSVAAAGHGQLRQMLAAKSRSGARRYIEVEARNSTRTCATCGAITGPSGRVGLSVRQWQCGACGAHHDRDVNAAVNALLAGGGQPLECHTAGQQHRPAA